MKPERLQLMLPLLNSKPSKQQNRHGWFVATCPFAPWTHTGAKDTNPSFAVSTRVNRKQVYTCFSCNEAGLLEHLPFDVRDRYRESERPGNYQFGKAMEVLVAEDEDELDIDIPDFEEEPAYDPETITPWPEWYLESFKSVFAYPEAVEYLRTRQVNKAVVQDLDMRYDSQRQRVCFPIRNFDGLLCGLHGRAIGDHPAKYYAYGYQGDRNPLVWMGEDTVDFYKTVVIAESVFDVASIWRVYRNVISPLSVGMSEKKIRRIDQGVQFISVFDHGTGGDTARELLDTYCETPVKHYIPDSGDAGEMSAEAVRKALKSVVN